MTTNEYIKETVDFVSRQPSEKITKEFLTAMFTEYRTEIISNCIDIISNSDVDATGRGVDELYEYLRKGEIK